jgi:hypothetical protein
MAKKLELVTTAPSADPDAIPAGLGPHGLALWRRVTDEYDLRDSGGSMCLELACRALDRAESCAAQIAVSGEMVKTRTGMRENPLLRHVLSNRAFCVRTLQKLGLNFEPTQHLGRPPGAS